VSDLGELRDLSSAISAKDQALLRKITVKEVKKVLSKEK
jgi:hypothetical protein